MRRNEVSRRAFLRRAAAALAAGMVVPRLARACPDGGPTLSELANELGIWIGPALAYPALVNDDQYGSTAAEQFNFLTPENAMKWAATEPQQGVYTFDQADTIVQFASDNGLAVHGHNLVWHTSNPNWLQNGNFNRDQMIAILSDHIYTVAGRYAGSIAAWDVVNEALNGGSLRSSIWSQRIGPDFLDIAYGFARDADPYALLVYNDYSIETLNTKSDAAYNLLADMISRGIPIDGIGMQMHIDRFGIDYGSFAQNLQRFADLGLALFITEMDVRLQVPATDAELQMQADVYYNIMDVCLQQPAVRGFQMWGFTDKYSWIPGSFPGFGAALIFDASYNPKPAFYALQSRMMQ